MTPLALLQLLTEVMRLINNIYEDQPPAQRRASALWFWRYILKPILMPALTPEQRQMVEDAESAEWPAAA